MYGRYDSDHVKVLMRWADGMAVGWQHNPKYGRTMRNWGVPCYGEDTMLRGLGIPMAYIQGVDYYALYSILGAIPKYRKHW